MIDAVKANNLERVRLLVEEGADKEMGDCEGKTPLYWVSQLGRPDVARYLMEQGAMVGKTIRGETYLLIAIRRNHFDVALCLIEHGADGDKADNNGDTPLHLAIRKGYLGVVRCLLEKGVDRDKANNIGRTPLYDAAAAGHLGVVRCL